MTGIVAAPQVDATPSRVMMSLFTRMSSSRSSAVSSFWNPQLLSITDPVTTPGIAAQP
jgi:hypothetical protein